MVMDRGALGREVTAEKGTQKGIQGGSPHSIDIDRRIETVQAAGISAGGSMNRSEGARNDKGRIGGASRGAQRGPGQRVERERWDEGYRDVEELSQWKRKRDGVEAWVNVCMCQLMDIGLDNTTATQSSAKTAIPARSLNSACVIAILHAKPLLTAPSTLSHKPLLQVPRLDFSTLSINFENDSLFIANRYTLNVLPVSKYSTSPPQSTFLHSLVPYSITSQPSVPGVVCA